MGVPRRRANTPCRPSWAIRRGWLSARADCVAGAYVLSRRRDATRAEVGKARADDCAGTVAHLGHVHCVGRRHAIDEWYSLFLLPPRRRMEYRRMEYRPMDGGRARPRGIRARRTRDTRPLVSSELGPYRRRAA